MTEITLKKGSGKPADTALVEAEFALDVATGKIYSKLSDGKVRALNDAEFIGIDANADNYQYWQYKINGFNTTSVMSTSVLDFQSGDGIQIDKEGYGIKISATGGSAGNPDWADIENKPAEFPPSSHTHLVADITDFDPADYQPVGDYLSEAPEDGKQYARKDAGWSEVQATGGSSLWEQNGSDIYYDKGAVMVGNKLTAGGLIVNGTNSFIKCELDHEGTGTQIWQTTTNFAIYPNGESSKGFTINNATGNVGIGMAPTRSTFDLSAKEQLAQWKAKAKKASWPIVTDNAFDQEPTEDLVAQWIETRAAGDKLQVEGNGSFSGTVAADTVKTDRVGSAISGRAGFQFASSSNILPIASDGTLTNGVASLGRNADGNFKDAYFSGTIYGRVDDVDDHIKAITPTQIANWDAGTSGGGGPSANIDSRIKDDDIIHWNKAWDWGDHSAANYQPAGNYEIAGTAYTKSQSDAKYELKGAGSGNYVPLTGNSTVAGTITATDFIATSDERVKDNITTAPVGLIDSLKGREWDWKESGEKGSGVVAQELEQVLPHLVHTDDDGMKAVAYNGLIGYLIEEVKALKAEVQELRAGN